MNRRKVNLVIIALALLFFVGGAQSRALAQQPGGTTTQPVQPAPSGNTPTQSTPPASGVNVAPS
ncbi:MAG TPA: hypothetical protein VD861_13745, partial [Pyrinomonadaceae bacterium]|nr:hypothetical protein [Pyrinomonadaceae bacterium]